MNKIVHICFCGGFSDGWNYQENLLTKYHKRIGYDVTLITSKYEVNTTGNVDKAKKTRYTNKDGVKIIRLPMSGIECYRRRFQVYKGFYKTLEEISPDIIFIHSVSFLDIKRIIRFLEAHRDVIAYADNHADFSNSARNFLSKYVLHKIIWRIYARSLIPYVKRFYGVLPARVDFLRKIYGIPDEKTELLLMGADDDYISDEYKDTNNKEVRNAYNIAEDDFLIVTGGKIDKAKTQTLLLMKAVNRIKDSRLHMIVFGSIIDDLKENVWELANSNIHYVGWLNSKEIFKYFDAADLVAFPGRHSVLWEQAVAQGVPLVVRHWEGTHHIDIGGNVKFIRKDTVEDIEKIIREVIYDKKEYNKMLNVAQSDRRKKFLYSRIAEQSIRDCL